MEKVDRNFLALSAIYAVLGMGIGLYMASVESFKYSPVHSHLTLFGFVSMAIYGLAYRSGLAKTDGWARAHFWVAAVGAIVFSLGEGVAISGNTIAFAVVGSMLVILSALQFVVAIFRA
jgi:hypothetical protein